MAAMVLPWADEEPVFHAINAATERAPVIPHRLPCSNSAAISTICASMALRWPANSANFSNSTPTRSFGRIATAPDAVSEDMTPS